MHSEFVTLTPENLATEHLCCIIRSKKPHPGVEAKRQWLADRLAEGHVLRKLPVKAPVFIEYAPLETAWVPVTGDNYLYLYCLWVDPAHKGRGWGTALLEDCLEDARARGRSGVCMLGAAKQKAWLSDQAFARRAGFQAVDAAADGYELLALSFDGTAPRFPEAVRHPRIDDDGLTVYYDMQCPFIHQTVELARRTCAEAGVPLSLVRVETREQAKALPCVFNNFAVFYRGRFQTVNLPDAAALGRMLRQGGAG